MLVDEGHGFLEEVAAFAHGPVVVLFKEHGADSQITDASSSRGQRLPDELGR